MDRQTGKCRQLSRRGFLGASLAAAGVFEDGREAFFGGTCCRHACGQCEPACPFGVPIQAKLLLASERLTIRGGP